MLGKFVSVVILFLMVSESSRNLCVMVLFFGNLVCVWVGLIWI